jgi:glyoxylase-like metal-dependent hydrolase (beta-lactamase superfamily II)
MLIKTLPVGQLETNCYILTDENTKKCAIIDPGAEANTILDYIESNNLTPVAIFITHGHFDHIMALEELVEVTEIPTYIHELEYDKDAKGNRHKLSTHSKLNFYSEGDEIEVGNLKVTILETPGHSLGSVTIKCEDALFTGDTLFSGDCGRTDLEGGSYATILKSLKRLAELEGNYEVYPGHEESTTLDKERKFNRNMREALGH